MRRRIRCSKVKVERKPHIVFYMSRTAAAAAAATAAAAAAAAACFQFQQLNQENKKVFGIPLLNSFSKFKRLQIRVCPRFFDQVTH